MHILYISVSCYAGVRYGKFRCAKDVRSVVMPQSVTMPILTVIGNKEMYIENFKSIMEYECDSVKVITRRGIVHVKEVTLI